MANINPDNSTVSPEVKASSSLATLRKINLNVDLATQAELISAYNDLSSQISAATSSYIEADNALSNALTAELAVGVSAADEQETQFVYTITQGGESVGTINVAKDMFVTSAWFTGTTLYLSVRGQDTPISTDLSGLVDVYDGGTTDTAIVTVENNTICVDVLDKGYATTTYVNEVSAAVSAAANTRLTALEDSVLTAITNGTDGEYVTTTVGTKADNSQSVAVAVTVAELTAGTAGLAEATDVKAYVDNAVSDATDSLSSAVSAVVGKVESTSATWDTAVTDLATFRDNVNGAGTTLDGAITAKAVSAYVDIDEIITELEALKAAVKTFAGSASNA